MLALDRLTVDIQNSRILRGISLKVAAGELICLVGRNGAGKTPSCRTIMGFIKPVSGAVRFRDEMLTGMPTHRIVALSEGKVLADLPPRAFFADPVIIETVVGKRRGH